MIKRVKLKGYKSFENFEIYLKPLTVLFGQNNAGKSNFLDALMLLSRTAACRTLQEAFEPPYRGSHLESFSFGPDGVKGLMKKESASFSMEVDVELSPVVISRVNRQIVEMKRSRDNHDEEEPGFVKEKNLRYNIKIEILPASGILRVSDECLEAIRRDGKPKASRRPFMEKVGKEIHLRMEGHSHPIYYDIHLDRSILSTPLYAPHYPHMVAMQQELWSWNFSSFEPRDRMRMSNPVKEVSHIGFMGEELAPFLNTLKTIDMKQFESMVESLRRFMPSMSGVEVDVNDTGNVVLHVLDDKKNVPSGVMSEGILRILGLLALWGVKDTPSVIGIEEPENGLDPHRIKIAAELLKNRAVAGKTQVIVTSHSPVLTDIMPDEYLYICRKIDGETIIEPFSNWGPLSRKLVIDRAFGNETGE